MSSASETHLPFVRPETTEYLWVLEPIPQLLHKEQKGGIVLNFHIQMN